MKLLAILALAFGANATSDCLICGGCYSMVTHIISCVSNITQCPYELNYYGGLYSQYMFYSFAEECPLEYCYRTQDTAYSATCLDGDLASANCCPFVYEAIAGYTPVSLVMANKGGLRAGREYARRVLKISLSSDTPTRRADHADIDGDMETMKNWLEGESDDPVELKHKTFNFTKAYFYYSGTNNFATDYWLSLIHI